MRTLFLILLCLIIMAPSASARQQRDNGSDSTATVQSSSDTKDKASDSSSRSSTESDRSAARSTPREDPPATVTRSEPAPEPPAPRPDPPKPIEDTSRKSDSTSYQPSNPAPEPLKYTPPTPTVSESASNRSDRSSSSDNSSDKPLSRREIKQQDNSTMSNNPARNSGDTIPVSAPRGNTYHPSANSQPVNTPSDTSGNTVTHTPANTTASSTRYSPSKDAKRQQTAKDAQTKAQRDTARSADKSGAATGYIPTGQTPRTGRPPLASGRTAGGTTNGAGYRPTDRTNTFGYAPQGTVYRVGYRPSKPIRPHGYTPPFVSDGRWRYPQTHFPRPCFFGHWAYEYYPGFSWRSSFFYFGIYPYIEVASIEEYPQETIEFVSEPLYISGSNYVYNSRWDRIDEALADIRSAWISGRFDLLKDHVQPESTIAVLIDGQYDYAISSDDYLSMTEDALGELNTVSFIWNKVRERSDGTVMAFADHSYWSNDRARTVYVSYTFKKVGRDYFISEIGSSANPLN